MDRGGALPINSGDLHCARLAGVVGDHDPGGVTEKTGWEGGGSFSVVGLNGIGDKVFQHGALDDPFDPERSSHLAAMEQRTSGASKPGEPTLFDADSTAGVGVA